MKNIMKKCFAFLLSFSLIQPAVPLTILAEEADAEEMQEEIITEAAEEEAVEETEEEPVLSEVMEEAEEVISLEAETAEPEAAFNEPVEDGIQAAGTFADPIPLTLDQYTSVNIKTAGAGLVYSFTPSVSGYYNLSSYGDSDPMVYLWANGSDHWMETDNNTGNDNNFSLTYKLRAGWKYYYQVKLANQYVTGSFNMRVTRDNMLTVVPIGYTERYITAGHATELKVKVLADDTTGITYKWYKQIPGHVESYEFLGVTTDSYTHPVKKADTIMVIAYDRFGNYADAKFHIYPQNHLKAEFVVPDTYVRASNSTYQIQPKITADDKTGMTYQWWKIDIKTPRLIQFNYSFNRFAA